MKRESPDVVVIGGGHNGLVAACYCAQAKLRTVVCEAAPMPGGMSRTEFPFPEAPGHGTHNGAVDLVFLHASTIVKDLRLTEAGFRFVEVDPQYVHLDPDGASLLHWRDPRRSADEITRFSRKDAETFLEMNRLAKTIADASLPYTTANPMRPPPQVIARVLRSLVRDRKALGDAMDLVMTPPLQFLKTRFEHPMVQNKLAVMLWGMPLRAPGLGMGFVLYEYTNRFGSNRVVGGMSGLIDALARRLESLGGSVRPASRVEEIIVTGGRARGVRLTSGEEIYANQAVLAACDPRFTLGRALPSGTLPDTMEKRLRRMPCEADGTGNLKVDVALSGQLSLRRFEEARGDGIDLRRPIATFGSVDDVMRADALAGAGLLSEPIPFVGVVQNAVDATLAPASQDSLYLWSGWVPVEPAEPLADFRKQAGEALVTNAATYYEGIESYEITRRVETSIDMATRYNSTRGSIYQVDFSPARTGPLRPAWGLAGYRTPVKRLYLSGAAMHPGGGVQGLPGQLAARTVLRDLKKTRTS